MRRPPPPPDHTMRSTAAYSRCIALLCSAAELGQGGITHHVSWPHIQSQNVVKQPSLPQPLKLPHSVAMGREKKSLRSRSNTAKPNHKVRGCLPLPSLIARGIPYGDTKNVLTTPSPPSTFHAYAPAPCPVRIPTTALHRWRRRAPQLVENLSPRARHTLVRPRHHACHPFTAIGVTLATRPSPSAARGVAALSCLPPP